MADRLEINNSEIRGDTVAGDKTVYEAPLTTLEQVIEHIITNSNGADEVLTDVIDELAGYLTDRPDREVIGLEEKLVQGDRNELAPNAKYLKNKFERKLAKQELSRTTQSIYVQVLSSIITAFEQKVRPLILDKRGKPEVDAAIHNEIILPVHKAVIRFDMLVTTEEVAGMLYFLTGKCHLVWSK
ncbi:MAG: hypothetical protein Q9N62_07240 [Ghiorsea sp.]|nr:hypothetical protein [Ghiorsea sp.]